MADAEVSKTFGGKLPCRFDPGLRHQFFVRIIAQTPWAGPSSTPQACYKCERIRALPTSGQPLYILKAELYDIHGAGIALRD